MIFHPGFYLISLMAILINNQWTFHKVTPNFRRNTKSTNPKYSSIQVQGIKIHEGKYKDVFQEDSYLM